MPVRPAALLHGNGRGPQGPAVVRRHGLALGLGLVALAALAALLSAPAEAVDIVSAGPLTRISISDKLACEVEIYGVPQYEDGTCETMMTHFGVWPPSSAWSPTWCVCSWSPVIQSPVTGLGTAASPYQVETVVEVVGRGLEVRQFDRYVVGRSYWDVTIEVTNTGASSASIMAYRGAICRIDDVTTGPFYGALGISAAGSVACSRNPNNSPPGSFAELVPEAGAASHYIEDKWSAGFHYDGVDTGVHYSDTCKCTTDTAPVQNSHGLSWRRTIPSAGCVSITVRHNFDAAAGAPTTTTPCPPVTCSTLPPAPALTVTPSTTPLENDLVWSVPPAPLGCAPDGYRITRTPSGTPFPFTSTSWATSYADTAITGCADYTYTVAVHNAFGWGPASAPATVTTGLTAPAAVTGAGVATSPGTPGPPPFFNTVSWGPPSTGCPVDGYNVARLAPSPAPIASGIPGFSATDFDVPPCTFHRYQVQAFNAAGGGPWASTPSVLTATIPPDAPTLTSVTAPGPLVRWSPPAPASTPAGCNVDHYTVHKVPAPMVPTVASPRLCTVAGSGAPLRCMDSVPASCTPTRFNYAVVAWTKDPATMSVWNGPESNVMGYTAPLLPPGMPTGLTVTAKPLLVLPDPLDAFTAVVDWDAPATGCPVVRYDVLRDTAVVASTTPPTTVHEDRILTPCETYTYQVRAFGVTGLATTTAPVSYTHWPFGVDVCPPPDCTGLGVHTRFLYIEDDCSAYSCAARAVEDPLRFFDEDLCEVCPTPQDPIPPQVRDDCEVVCNLHDVTCGIVDCSIFRPNPIVWFDDGCFVRTCLDLDADDLAASFRDDPCNLCPVLSNPIVGMEDDCRLTGCLTDADGCNVDACAAVTGLLDSLRTRTSCLEPCDQLPNLVCDTDLQELCERLTQRPDCFIDIT